FAELRATMIDGRPSHGAQHALRHIGRAGNLKEMTSTSVSHYLGFSVGKDVIFYHIPSGGASAWRPGAVHSSRTLSRRHPSMKPLVLFVAACGVALAQPCADQSPMGAPGASPAWNGWGVDIQNTRFQPAKDAG